jgi:hypothetical protein
MKVGTSDIIHRLKYSFYATLVFILISNPNTYSFTNSLFQGTLFIVQNDVPTAVGYLLHSILFFLCLSAIFMFPKTM